MRPVLRIKLAALVLLCFAPMSWGLGLGDITMRSYLNEPLRAEVALLNVGELEVEDIRIRLATQEDFDRLGLDRAYFLTSVRFEVVLDGANSKIIMTTEQPLLEPYLDFLVETRWPAGRLLREYTVLVDLPAKGRVAPVVSRDGEGARAAPGSALAAVEQPPSSAQSAVEASRPVDREYDRDTRERPEAGGRYLVQTNDTLWEIAAAARPSGASVEQTMLATAAMNQDAFRGGNINGLKAGYVLELPAADEILTTSSEALNLVAQQNRDWRDGVWRKPALRVVADNEFESTEDLLDVEDESVGMTDSDAGFSDPYEAGVTGGASVSSMMDDGRTTTEPSPELMQIEARLGDLSEQLAQLQSLVELKDQQIAALQAQLDDQSAQPAAPVETVDSAVSMPVEEVAQESPQPAPVTEPVPQPVVQTPAVAEPAMGLPWWIYVAGGVVVLALGGFLYVRRTNGRFSAAMATAPAAQRETSRAQAKEAVAEEGKKAEPQAAAATESEDGERGYGAKLHNDYAEENAVSDAIAEADIYIAYGRYQQALDLLSSASEADPSNAAAYLKMMEIYLKNDRKEEAEALLDSVEKTHDMSAIRDAMELLSGAENASAELDLGELSEPVVPEAEQEQPGLASMDFDLVAPSTPSSGQATFQAEETELNKPKPEDQPLDLDLDLGSFTSSSTEPEITPVEATPVAAADPEPKPEPELPVRDDPMAEQLEPELGEADWGDMSESVVADDGKLPPELAEVLGTEFAPEATELSIDEEDNKLVYASEADPMDTKLDLARAYLDMGDEDGARPVLEEVVANGDLQQQAEARELLIRID